MPPIRVLLVDHSPEFLDSAARVLAGNPTVEVVGRASSGREALHAARERRPDLVLIDLWLGDMGGLETAREIKRRARAERIVIVTLHQHEPGVCRTVLEAIGADAFVTKATFDAAMPPLIGRLFPPRHAPVDPA